MQEIKIRVDKQRDLHHFKAFNDKGLEVNMDSNDDQDFHGPTPVELMLMAIGGCSGIDVVDFMHEENEIFKSFSIDVIGKRNKSKSPSLVEDIQVKYKVEGEIPAAKVLRAVQLSMDKYCTVAKMIEGKARVNYTVELNGKMIGEEEDFKESVYLAEKIVNNE